MSSRFCALAQNERAVWRMGCYLSNGHPFEMDFNSGLLEINSLLNSGLMNLSYANAGICDKNGKLLFYTNCIYVANAHHDMMENGNDLNPGQFTDTYKRIGSIISQGAIVLPDPADTSEYYLFHSDMNTNNASSRALLITKINMSFNDGLGKVIYKNNVAYTQSLIAGQLTAVKHANGRDWWLVLHHRETNEYVLFLLSLNGLNPPKIQAIGNAYRNPVYALFSPDGKKYAAIYDDGRYVDILNFNRCTGVFTDLLHAKMPGSEKASGCSFSTKSQLFYVSTKNNIYQYDLKAPDVEASITKVSTWDSIPDPDGPTFAAQQLGPDGKIYITESGAYNLNVINFPDNIGISCDVQQHSISQNGRSNGTFPNYPFYNLGEVDESICDSLINYVSTSMFDENNIVVYPNPVNDIVNIRTNIENGYIALYDYLGQIIVDKKLYFDSEIDLSIITKGIYLIKIRNLKTSESWIKKLIIE